MQFFVKVKNEATTRISEVVTTFVSRGWKVTTTIYGNQPSTLEHSINGGQETTRIDSHSQRVLYKFSHGREFINRCLEMIVELSSSHHPTATCTAANAALLHFVRAPATRAGPPLSIALPTTAPRSV